ncbi:MAG: outer membrane beta-barrel protein, partial [Desulfobacterales bacterium]|nr:outer membrane beta-barrel protein [Desulfobacterales bacterium]
SVGEDSKFYIGVFSSYAFDNIDGDSAQNKLGNVDSVDFGNVFNAQLRGGYNLNKYVTSELTFEYINSFDAEGILNYKNRAELKVVSLIFSGKLKYPDFKEFVPYVLLGVGFVDIDEYLKVDNTVIKTDQSSGISRIGLGVDYYLTSIFSMSLEVAYIKGLGITDYLSYTNASIGLSYHF